MSWTVDELDLRVGTALCQRAGVGDPDLRTLAALVASAPRGGHVCVDLDTVDGDVLLQRPPPTGAGPAPDPEVLAPLGDPRPLLVRAASTPLARTADQPDRVTPLVIDDARVYLDRYWSYEDRLLHELRRRSGAPLREDGDAVVRAVLDVVAPHDPTGPPVDRQRLAVAVSLLRRLAVVSGGPGTGKTHTVVSLLVGRVLAAEGRGEGPPRIAIAAPTGKAAARMEQAIATAVTERSLPAAAVEQVQRLRGRTVHGLLGYQRWSPTRFRHDRGNRLPVDLVVIDEASMVPLSLMTKLVEAVREDATIVLVGDRNQLASVEAGAVLGDVCGPADVPSSLRLSASWAERLGAVVDAPVADEATTMPAEGVWDGIVQLERFRRFGPDSGIGAVARAIQRTDAAADVVLDLLRGVAVEPGADVDAYHDVALVPADDGSRLPRTLRDRVVAAFEPYLEAVAAASGAGDDEESAVEHARRALEALDAVRVLCAVREGPLGVREVGSTVERWVAAGGGLRTASGWYVGRPVLVTRNDHDLGVMNGDVGVTLQRGGRLVVAFLLADDSIRFVPASRIADCESVWAMTIHKAQGSQFDHAVVVLPERDTDVVTRELVYTGVTRARGEVTVVAAADRLAAALTRPVRRATGLRQRLWDAPG